jgi:hypothetical protein
MSDLQPAKNYWFPAKTYGWGWGIPITWQGWVVMVLFGVLLASAIALFLTDKDHAKFLLSIGVLCAGLTGVCWLKGEPLRWRWGDDT